MKLPATFSAFALLWAPAVFPQNAAAEPPVATNGGLSAALTELGRAPRRIPFKEVIQATTQHRIVDFDSHNPAHAELRQRILKAAQLAGEKARREGIATARANEAGNAMETFVKAAFAECGLEARTPARSGGGAQAAGYPDLEIAGAVPCYLELKTFNATTANTTQRSFYYSPSERPKVTRDALHLLLAFQMEKIVHDSETRFQPVRWKLVSLEDLEVELKFEFNQSNRGLYDPARTGAGLGEGALE